MSQNWRQAAISQSEEAFFKPRRNAVVAEFNQQIVGFSDGVGVRLFEHALQVLERKMKVAAKSQLQGQLSTDLLPQPVEKVGKIGSIVKVTIVGVWRGHRMCNAVRRRHSAHFNRDIPRLGPVVDFREKMAMNVNHHEVS